MTFLTEKPQAIRLPSVAYCASELNLSPNYLATLLKRDGKSAHEFIQFKLIDVAKERIFDPNKSLSEIAYGLGFKYPHTLRECSSNM